MTSIESITSVRARLKIVDSIRAAVALPNLAGSPWAVLLPAFDEAELQAVQSCALELVAIGCVEFCLVGSMASIAEDELDHALEASGHLNIVTTAFTDIAEACEYFLFGAGGSGAVLVAIAGAHSELRDALIPSPPMKSRSSDWKWVGHLLVMWPVYTAVVGIIAACFWVGGASCLGGHP